ncbi:MAG TPA: hypothetical protein DEA08_04635 [Planctomycetes bacterium]|nr:hypothetical protein [Planctomycetota bacterium]
MRERLLRALAALAVRHSGLVIGVSLLLAAVAGGAAALHLGLDSDQDRLASPDLPYQRDYIGFLDTFGDREYLYVVVDTSADPATAQAFANDVAADLASRPDLFQDVHAGYTDEDLGDNLLLLAPDADVERLVAELTPAAEELRSLARVESYAALLDLVGGELQSASAEPEAATGAEAGLVLLSGLVGELEASARPPAEAPGPEAALDPFLPALHVPDELRQQRFGPLLVVSAIPRKDFAQLDPVAASLGEARAAVERARRSYPAVEAGVTGRAALSADEVNRTSDDMALAALLAIAGVSLAFALFFRSLLRPLLAMVALLVGIAWTAGFATLAVGTLNFLSSVFLVILIGIGVDFGIHLLARYQSALGEGDVAAAATAAVLHVGRGNLTAALTTALAFYTTTLSDFLGLAELGLIAGTGILLCCLSTMLVLPALLVVVDGRRSGLEAPPLPTFAALERLAERPLLVLGGALLLSSLGFLGARHLSFNENLLSLQASGEESVVWERRLMAADKGTWLTVSLVEDVSAAARRQAEFAALDSSVVAGAESAALLVGPAVEARRARLRALAGRIGALEPAPPVPAVEPEALRSAIEELALALGEAAEGALRAGPEAREAVARLLELEERLSALAEELPPTELLSQRQAAFVGELQARLRRLVDLLEPSGYTLATLPEPWRGHLVGNDGRLAVYVHPQEDLWDPAALARFLRAVRQVDPAVTGATVSVYESTGVMRESVQQATALTLILVVGVLLLDFRGRAALLALVPLLVGGFWLAAAMGGLGVHFNMANFFTVPVLIGLGIDDGVHVMNRWCEAPGEPLVAHATGTGVILSSLTTAIGFGAMATSSHPGLASMGHVMVLGALALLLAALVLLPALARLWGPRRGKALS